MIELPLPRDSAMSAVCAALRAQRGFESAMRLSSSAVQHTSWAAARCYAGTPRATPGQAGQDVIIVGAGHNGLVASILLAMQGLRVRVIEAKDAVGGACKTEYPFKKAPGLGQSTGAYLLGKHLPAHSGGRTCGVCTFRCKLHPHFHACMPQMVARIPWAPLPTHTSRPGSFWYASPFPVGRP